MKLSAEEFEARIEQRYDEEQKFMHYLSRGNIEQCIHYGQKGVAAYRAGEMEDIYARYADPLRAHKNAMIILNTICRVAARRGGVPPAVVNFLSQKYAVAIEQAESVQVIVDRLWPIMILEYCETVRSSASVHYSKLVNDTINYILEHLPDEISVQGMAKELYVNASSLSHKFREETGETISQYICKSRVRLAQYYFERGNRNISEVARLSGFSDGNYFSRTYKKVTGMTPTDYIRQLKE